MKHFYVQSFLLPLCFCLILFSQPIFSDTKKHTGIDLAKFEQKVYSQNGEDGVIDAIFSYIGTEKNYFVEFGVEDGSECNTRWLRIKGWNGLMMDGFHENPSINLRKEFITAENINNLFEKYNVPNNFDLLSIDIDYNDFYVWNAISSKYSPRVVIIEYNATHLPHADKVVMYNPNYMWDGTNYYGASILALARLGKKKGYTLVYAENKGVNLFFIRNDILKKVSYKFKNVGNVSQIYKFPKYGRGPNGGHVADPLQRAYISSREIIGHVN